MAQEFRHHIRFRHLLIALPVNCDVKLLYSSALGAASTLRDAGVSPRQATRGTSLSSPCFGDLRVQPTPRPKGPKYWRTQHSPRGMGYARRTGSGPGRIRTEKPGNCSVAP